MLPSATASTFIDADLTSRDGRLCGMKRSRIYGSEARCKTALARHLRSLDELLDQAVGVRNRIEGLVGPLAEFRAIDAEREWEEDVRRWFTAARRGMRKYLQDQFGAALPILAAGLPPDSGKPRHAIGLANGVPWLEDARDELRSLQAILGVRRGVAAGVPRSVRFEELEASGLISEKMIRDYAKEMASPRTPGQLHHAIGAAKEITEATLRAALDRLGRDYASRDDLPRLMKKWRAAVAELAPPDPEGKVALDRAQAALAQLVAFLAEWRNAYGRGHGRARYPPGLSTRHARLATDAAETSVRFIATTMDDLELLLPRLDDQRPA
jgi:hypothetical protein